MFEYSGAVLQVFCVMAVYNPLEKNLEFSGSHGFSDIAFRHESDAL